MFSHFSNSSLHDLFLQSINSNRWITRYGPKDSVIVSRDWSRDDAGRDNRFVNLILKLKP